MCNGCAAVDAIWQAFAVLLPVRTVGVMGDHRTYDYVCDSSLAVVSGLAERKPVFHTEADFQPELAWELRR